MVMLSSCKTSCKLPEQSKVNQIILRDEIFDDKDLIDNFYKMIKNRTPTTLTNSQDTLFEIKVSEIGEDPSYTRIVFLYSGEGNSDCFMRIGKCKQYEKLTVTAKELKSIFVKKTD